LRYNYERGFFIDWRKHGRQAGLPFKSRISISESCGDIARASSIYETAAWGKEDQSAFLNQVLKLKTKLDPKGLLRGLLEIEHQLGRERIGKYGPRVIDLDILFFNDEVVREEGLTIPHPQMQNRRFVLEPLNEIAPEKMHPVLQKKIAQLLAECPDPLPVNKIN
jgi:2-amino-4-hydroxy-6-hydroxymethyldihydropteridine diphosphokinase